MVEISKESDRRGFTLIELIVVITIIAVLSALTLLSFQGTTESSQLSKLKAELSQARSVSAIYIEQNDDYSGFCSDQNIQRIDSAFMDTFSGAGNSFSCNATAFRWSIQATLNEKYDFLKEDTSGSGNILLCVDSENVFEEFDSNDDMLETHECKKTTP